VLKVDDVFVVRSLNVEVTSEEESREEGIANL
jgi:hypothetical protein